MTTLGISSGRDVIYLDNAATSFPKAPGVAEAVRGCIEGLSGSPGRSGRATALEAERRILGARQSLARLFNVPDSRQIIFCLNATDALNIALKGLLRPGDHVVTTHIEHNAVARPLRRLQTQGVELTRIESSPEGEQDLDSLRASFRDNTRLLACVHASNVLGTILPIAEMAQIAHEARVPILVDASQTAGTVEIDVQETGIDLLAFTGHKGLLGPQGTGGLYVREGLELRPLREGGTGSRSESDVQPDFMPDHLEAGTMNTPGIVGLGVAVEWVLNEGLAAVRAREEELTSGLLSALSQIPEVRVYGPPDAPRRVGLVSLNVADLDAAEVCAALEEEYGIVTRCGLHCAPWAHAIAGTLETGALRLSVSYFTSVDEIARTADALREIAGGASGGR